MDQILILGATEVTGWIFHQDIVQAYRCQLETLIQITHDRIPILTSIINDSY